MNCTGCHTPPLQGSDIPSNRRYMFTMITSFFPIIYHSHRCFQTNIYSIQNFSDILLILPPLEFLQIFHHHYHGNCRILADGMRIFNLECCYCFTSIFAEDLNPVTLGIASECIYTTFFWTPTSHTLCQLSEDVLF